ncbi:XRE family transcriptional regulator [Aliarcobacter butzleri]|uniref:XRE family transcriptional regulator n=1 Tax=Aliarcobacter butzleri TaxID=28197 RepID=UPI002B241826|nr:XRE family transcriptional regulator [Aliarcobacter butzleri]
MNNDTFEKKLEDSNINKTIFSELTSLPYQTLMNWKRNDRVPVWVESWLENYNKVKAYNDIKEKILEIENIKIKTL